MSGTIAAPTVLDATVLSNLASTDGIRLASSELPRPVTVPAVERELRHGTDEGYTFLEHVLDALDEAIPVVEPSGPVPEKLATALDSGEAEALHLARSEAGTLVSDDGDARSLAEGVGVPVTGSLGVLARGVVSGAITVDTADSWLSTWRTEYGYRSPVETLSDVLPE